MTEFPTLQSKDGTMIVSFYPVKVPTVTSVKPGHLRFLSGKVLIQSPRNVSTKQIESVRLLNVLLLVMLSFKTTQIFPNFTIL